MLDVISIKDLSRDVIEELISDALARKKSLVTQKSCDGKVMASLFCENSTRTRESHERAAKRLGMDVIGFTGTEGTSIKKGEPLADTVRMYEGYGADVIVLRHSLEGAARFCADVVSIPVINAGDGSNSHPTQTLLDLMTIYEKFGRIDGIRIALVGDLKYGRTVHSLVTGLSLFNNIQLQLVSHPSLQMPSRFVHDFEKKMGSKVTYSADLNSALLTSDIIYMTRIQRERFPKGPEGEFEYKKVSSLFHVSAKTLQNTSVGIMHPLPRYKHMIEIDVDVDNLPHAWYLEQAKNGLFMREAILHQLVCNRKTRSNENIEPEQLWHDLPIRNKVRRDQQIVYKLDNGTLIDHIHRGKGKDVLHVLHIDPDTPFVHARHLDSSRLGKKDIIGFQNRELSEKELSKLALVAPEATINIIRDKKVYKKGKVILPKVITKFVNCPNPRCITHNDHKEFAPQKFYVESQQPLVLRCHYCTIPIRRDNLILSTD